MNINQLIFLEKNLTNVYKSAKKLHTDFAFQSMKTCTSLRRAGLWWNGKLLNWMFQMIMKALEYFSSSVGYSP